MIIDSLLFQIGAMLVLASIIGLLCLRLQQPLFFAYIFTGIVIGILGGSHLHDGEILRFFSELGIAFLLFLVGLELNLKNITHLGKTAVITALAQIVITATISFSVVIWLGMDIRAAVYVALAMTIASAVISVKYLNDKNALDTLYGKLDLVLHLVQDLVAVAAIIILSSLSANSGGEVGLIQTALVLTKGALLVTAHIFLSQHVLPKIFRQIAGSSELLLLASIAWCVFGAAIGVALGFSVEIGAFLAGLGLSSSSYQFQIAAKIKPLRDFFVVLFFISLGLQITISSPLQIILPAILLSLVVILVNPIVTAILLGRFGYKRHTAFFASMLMSQIGEFSLVLGALGVANQHLTGQQGSLITLTVLITMLVSSVLIKHEQAIYKKIRPFLLIIERPDVHERRIKPHKHWKDHVIILGAHRLGSDVLDVLQRGHNQVVVVDYDPDRISVLNRKGYATIFGDATDDTVLQEAGAVNARLIISTIPQHHATLQLLRQLKERGDMKRVIVTASSVEEAMLYYRLGAAYVIIPKLISSSAMMHFVKNHLTDLDQLEPAKLSHLQRLLVQQQIGI